MNNWSAKLTYDEVCEMKIWEIIEKERRNNSGNRDYIAKVEKDYFKFRNAWNKFAGLLIRDKNVEVIVPEITEDSELSLCCISKDKID